MKFQDRIDKIIDYPINLSNAGDSGSFNEPNDGRYSFYREQDLFMYPDLSLLPNQGSLRTRATNVFGKKENIIPLEGYYLGYELDQKRIGFASLLNTPEFSIQFFNELSPANSVMDKSFYYFLNALPLAPPIPVRHDAKKQQKDEVFDVNPALLFKNNAGVYSLPDTYMWWLGGMWKNRALPDYATIIQPQYINIEGSVNAGWKGVHFEIDPSKIYDDYFSSYIMKNIIGQTKPTLRVNIEKFRTKTNGIPINAVAVATGSGSQYTETVYGIDLIDGIGNYPDLFGTLHAVIYGNYLPNYANSKVLNWNVHDKLRTFPTYSYPLELGSAGLELNLYATYSVFNYIEVSEPVLPDVTHTTNKIKNQTYFDIYSMIWKYILYHLTRETPLTYDEILTKILENYKIKVWTENEIDEIKGKLFSEVPSYGVNKVKNLLATYDNTNPIVSRYTLFSSGDYFIDFIDLIALHAIQMAESFTSTIKLANPERYHIIDKGFVCVLYPSAGGVAGLQYVLNSLFSGSNNPSIAKFIDFSIMNNNAFSSTVINMILNSSRFVWGSGPFVGDATYNVKKMTEESDFSVIKNNSFLSKLDSEFLYSNSIHTTRANQVYFMDSNRDSERSNAFLSFNQAIDYIGCGALDVFESRFNGLFLKSNDGSNQAADILLSMLIVDSSDFAEIVVDGKTYKESEQIDLLLTYNVWLGKAYQYGLAFSTGQTTSASSLTNMYKVMNASLTQAQTRKIARLVKELNSQRSLFNVGSIFDYGTVMPSGVVAAGASALGSIKNMFNRALANGALNENDNGKFIKLCLFGNQAVPRYTQPRNDDDYLYQKYYWRGGTSNTVPSVSAWANHFFGTIDVQPNEATIKIAKDLMFLYFNDSGANETDCFNNMAKTIRGHLEESDKHISSCLASVKNYFDAASKPLVAQIQKVAASEPPNDINVMKQKTYYNIKSLFDNWIRVKSDNSAELVYTYNSVINPNSTQGSQASEDAFIKHFAFLDRANRDIGHNILVNISWLKTYYENNYGFKDVNTNISLYTFMSDLAKQHSSLIHALPAFINFGSFGVNEGNNFAGDLFGTYDYVDVIESSPKFIFQFIGNTNTILNIEQNKNLRSASKSYSLISSKDNKQSNISSNIGDSVHIPKDLMQTGATGMAFVVDFGEQHQQMFSNLQIDQSEYQNTEESFKVMTQFAQNRAQSQGGDLFSLFTERSYTAQIDSLGNLMIQPLMFFELTNIPLFYGTYWITNVRHMITPNDIKTTFKGVRQPMAVLPSQTDVLLQLSELNINNLLGANVIKKTVETGSGSGSAGSGSAGDGYTGGGSAGSGNILPLSTKLASKILMDNQVKVASFLKGKGLSQVVVAGIMGNMMTESKFKPTAGWTDVNGLRSQGLIQWNGTYDGSKGYNLSELGDTVESQLNYLVGGKTSNYRKYVEQAEKNKSQGATWTAYLFAKLVERCSFCTSDYNKYVNGGTVKHATTGQLIPVKPVERSRYALEFYNRFNNPNDSLYWGFVDPAYGKSQANNSTTPNKTGAKNATANFARVFVFGDSHTAGGLGASIGAELAKLNRTLVYDYYGLVSAGFKNKYLSKKDELLKKISAFNPDILVCVLGTNDMYYNTKDYYELIKTATAFFSAAFASHSPIVIVSLPYYKEPVRKITTDGLTEFAKQKNYKYIDMFAEGYPAPEFLKSDGYHFTVKGYQQAGKFIADRLTVI